MVQNQFGNFRLKEGMDVLGANGQKIGTVGKVVVGERTREPRFFTIEKGLIFTKDYIVPREAIMRVDEQGRAHVSIEKEKIERLPEYQNRAPTPEEARKAFEVMGARRSEGYEFTELPHGRQMGQGQTQGTVQGQGAQGRGLQRPYFVTNEEYRILPTEERERQGYRTEWDYEPYLGRGEMERR